MTQQKTYYRNKRGQFALDPAKRSQLLLDELYRAFDHFNNHFASGTLPKVVITIQEAGRKNALGWFGNSFWKDDICGTGVSEINLSAEHLSRGYRAILETLLHEMAHLHNAQQGVRDVTGHQYHNKHFKLAAEQFGLTVKRGKRGYAYTDLDAAAREAIDQFEPNREVYRGLGRKRVGRAPDTRYMSLVVSQELKPIINQAVSRSGYHNKRQFVEDAILQLAKLYT